MRHELLRCVPSLQLLLLFKSSACMAQGQGWLM